jgi:glycosyltransferase involved in cell wall biosynthesis
MEVSVVVPVYNGAETLPMLVEELAHILPSVAERYELVLVNDGSPDESWQVIERLMRGYAA